MKMKQQQKNEIEFIFMVYIHLQGVDVAKADVLFLWEDVFS